MAARRLVDTNNHTQNLRLAYDAGERRVEAAARDRRARQQRHDSDQLLVATIVFVLALLIASVLMDQVHASRITARLAALPTSRVIVSSGDSLWSIAETHAVEGVNTSELVDWLIKENGLSNTVLALGQSLTVPEASPTLPGA